jgi:uncharacterized membrane protein SpoIIM required for sporulation
MVSSGFDVQRFVRERTPEWKELETLLARVETHGIRSLGVEGARRFGKLYRNVSNDLVHAQTEVVDAALQDYLNDLVARAYAQIYTGTGARGPGVVKFFAVEFPRLVRAECKMVACAAMLLFGGAFFGAVAAAFDPDAMAVLLPEQHAEITPEERVASEEGRRDRAADEATLFSSFLFTHNIQVSFFAFVLGLTFGIGTASLLLYNGMPIGALAVQYHQAGHGLFFWAWILPHGIPELTEIAIAGAAGLVIARGLIVPGQRTRRDALVVEARRAAQLVVGGMPILVLAGVIEGTISQIHEPTMPYPLKLVFAALVGIGLFTWLALAGRGHAPPRAQERDRRARVAPTYHVS